MPEKVALELVKITGGTVNFIRPGELPALSLEHVTGEFSARSLDGPYKFTGNFDIGGAPRSLRFSTGRRETDGSVRLKAVLHDIEAELAYSLDGAVTGFGSDPSFDGQLLVRTEGDPGDTRVIAVPGEAPIEIKSRLKAGVARAELDDAEITLRMNGKQQALTGKLTLDYAGKPGFGGEISARLLNLDGLLDGGGQSISAGLAELGRLSLAEADRLGGGKLRIKLNQAAVGGDVVSDVTGEIATRGKDGISVSGLQAMLPGENRVSLEGDIRLAEPGPSFSGHVDVGGGRLSRLLRWAGTEAAPISGEGGGDFSFSGDVKVGAGSIVIGDASGSLLGSRFTGSIDLKSEVPRRADIRLRSERLDLAKALGADGLAPLAGYLTAKSGSAEPRDGRKAGPLDWLFDGETRLDLGVQSVSLPGLGEGSLEADVSAKAGSLAVRKFSFSSTGGLTLKAQGQLADLAGRARGGLSVEIDAENRDAFQLLAGLLDLPAAITQSEARSGLLAPAKLRLDVKSGIEGKGLEGQLRGTLASSRAEIDFDFDGALAERAAARIAVEAKLENPEGKALLRQLFPRIGEASGYRAGNGVATLTLKGVAKDNLDAVFEVRAAGVEASVKGRGAFPEAGTVFDGKASVNAADAALLSGLAGGPVNTDAQGNQFRAEASVALKDRTYRLSALTGEAGGAPFTGDGQLDLSGAIPKATGHVKAREASLPLLLAPLLAEAKEPAEAAPIVRSARRTLSVWPERPFESELIAAAEGTFKLDAGRLRLLGGVVLDKADVTAELSQGVLRIINVGGGLYGGSFSGSASLGKRGGGMAFEATGAAKGMSTGQIVRDARGNPLAEATASLEFFLKGEGLTPNGIAAGLSGDGKVALSGGRIPEFSPAAPRMVVAGASRTKAEQQPAGDRLVSMASDALRQGPLTFSPVEVPFAVKNGVVRFAKTELTGPGGWASIASFLELATLKLDSEWVISAAKPNTEGTEPQIAMAFVGTVEDIGRIPPDIEVEVLERFVTIARMEKDVETLEKLDVSGGKAKAKKPDVTAPGPAAAIPPPPKKPVPPEAKKPQTPAPKKPEAAVAPAVPPAPKGPEAAVPPVAPPSAAPTQLQGEGSVTTRPLPPLTAAPTAEPPVAPPAVQPSSPASEQAQSLPWLLPGAPPPGPTSAEAPSAPPEASPPPPPPRPAEPSFRDRDILRGAGD
ncbi:MAG: AsmA-like C-terminal region-containing protein [Pseudomonadota bacterium]|nr:AsmA-like C-terminal region-containing protein [Pseudomonadota bacterium]